MSLSLPLICFACYRNWVRESFKDKMELSKSQSWLGGKYYILTNSNGYWLLGVSIYIKVFLSRPGTNWASETNFVMNHASGAGLITRPVDQQSSTLQVYHTKRKILTIKLHLIM